jgi:CRP-like cAMP-binding protein
LLRRRIKARTFRKRQYVLQAGDVCESEYYVFKGCLRAYLVNEKGEEHIVQFAVEDWWVGDMYSFLTETPAKLNIETVEESTLLLIAKKDMEELYREIPKLERFFRILVQNAFIALQERVLDAMSKNVEQRYIEFHRKYPQIEQRVPQHMIASFLGATPEFLSRIRKNLSRK